MNETTNAVAVGTETVKPESVKRVLLGREHDVTAFASTDTSRYVLQSVNYNAAAKRVEATDGRHLIIVPVTESDEFPPLEGALNPAKSVVMPVAAFKKGLANIPKGCRLPILNHAVLSSNGKENSFVLSTSDLDNQQDVRARGIDGTYPNVDQVMPDAKPTVRVCFDASLLRDFCDYATKHAVCGDKPDEHSKIVLELVDELSPCKLKIQTASGEAIGVLMPMRLS